MVTRTRFSVPFVRTLPVFSASDLVRMCTRYALYYTYIAYLSERQKKEVQFPWDPVTSREHLSPPNILFARINVLILFTTPNTCDITHTHVNQVTPTEVHSIVATDGTIALFYGTFVALCNIGVSVRAPAVIVVCCDRVASLLTPQSGQVAGSSDPLRPGPPTGSCERFHGLSGSHWVNDVSIVLLPLRFGTGVTEIRSDLVSITDSLVDKVIVYVRAVRPAVNFRHGHQFLLRRHIVTGSRVGQHHANSVHGSTYNATNISFCAASTIVRLTNDALGRKCSGLSGCYPSVCWGLCGHENR